MLARIRKSMEEKDEGFTLIELLVVIIIIGILAAIAIPVFLNQRKKATEAGMKSDLRSVANEMETYYTDAQKYVAPTAGAAAGTAGNVAVVNGVGIKKSDPQTVITGVLQGTGNEEYCLTAVNAKVGTNWYYDNATGGLSKTAC